MLRLICLIFMISPVMAQESAQTLFQSAPADWRSEVIPFPLGFAPEIDLKGREELRFAPGMYKADADDYFSYTFLWWADGKVEVNEAMLQKHVLAYFTGLYKVVSKKQKKDISSFSVAVSAADKGTWYPDASQHFTATAKWVDPFVTEKPVILNMKIAQWGCQDQTAVFFLVSPQEQTHAVWKTMESMKAGACP